MASCCYESSKRSAKPGLPQSKVWLLEGMYWYCICGFTMLIHKITLIIAECVARKFGRSIFEQNSILIKKKCNQKCIDRANKQKKTLIGLLVDNFCSFFDHFCLVCIYVLIIYILRQHASNLAWLWSCSEYTRSLHLSLMLPPLASCMHIMPRTNGWAVIPSQKVTVFHMVDGLSPDIMHDVLEGTHLSCHWNNSYYILLKRRCCFPLTHSMRESRLMQTSQYLLNQHF